MELWVRLKSALIRSGDRISVVQLSTDPFKCLPKHWTARQLLDLIYVYDRQIQEQLQELHHSADKPFTVAICLSNCVAYIAAAIATIKAGAVFLPVDPRWPQLRIKEVLDHANAVLWLWMEPGVPGGHGLVLPASVIANNQCRPVQLASPDTVLCNHARLDDNKLTYASINDISGTLVHMHVNSGSVYLMYTSGSTGKPVGVYGLARGIINRCDWMAETFPWNVDSDLVCFKTAPCFVDSVWEMFGPLLGGVRLLAAPLATSTDPFLLSKALHDHGVTHITCIPTFWTLLLGALETRETEGHGELRLRQAVCSGEMLGGALLRHLQKVLPQGCRILNIYGSTETAADAAWFDCSAVAGPLDTNASVPVGFPLPGFVIACIQSSDSSSSSVACRLLPFGEEGEVVVGSLCELIAPSYHSNQLATSSSFIDVPLTEFSELNSLVDWSSVPFSSWKEYKTRKNNCPSLRMVCMGDLGHIQNGILILLGRQGNRVKISGARVDLEEIRLTLLAHPRVSRAAIKAWRRVDNAAFECVLVAYVELLAKGEEGEEEAERCVKGDVASLHSWCKSRLSRHSIPQEIVIMSKLPLLSSSGKVDIHSLPGTHLPFPVSKRKRFEEAKVSEASIFHAIAECLGHTHIEPSTNIFSLGASSLDAAEIADACGVDIFKVYQYPSVRQLFQYLASLDSNAIEGDKTRPKRATKDLNIVDYIPPHPKRYLHQNWKVSLSKCVDANPVLTANHVYTNSYGGDIVCCRIEDGQVVWRRENTVCQSLDVGLVWCPTLPPFESNLDSENSNDQESVHAVIAVTGNDGSLCFLDPRTGEDVSVNTDLREYGIRAVPAVDPWQHWVWIVTHRGRPGAARLVVIDPGNGRMIRSLSTLKLPAPSSSKVAFVNATDGCNCAYIACLDGSVLCTDTSRNNAILWNLKLDAPIFADPTPIVTSLHAGNPTALLVILTVKGRVSFITSRSGTIVWDYFLEGEGFFCSPAVQWCPNHSCVNFVATGLTFASRDGIITAIHELRNTVSQDTQKSNPRIKTFSTHMTITRIAFLFSKNTNTNSPSLLLMLTECGHLGLIDLRDGNIIDVYKLPASGAYGLSVKGTNVAIGCRDDCCYLLRVENLK